MHNNCYNNLGFNVLAQNICLFSQITDSPTKKITIFFNRTSNNINTDEQLRNYNNFKKIYINFFSECPFYTTNWKKFSNKYYQEISDFKPELAEHVMLNNMHYLKV